MDIHTMLSNAGADIRAMELRIEALTKDLERSNQDNERLRQENAAITAARMHAEADLIHYQNVFVASVCIEAGTFCKEFFAVTQEKIRERAEGAIQRMVEEKVERERENNRAEAMKDYLGNKPVAFDREETEEFDESIAKGYLTKEDEDFNESDKSLSELASKASEIPDTNTPTPQDAELIRPPAHASWGEAKAFWVRHCKLVRPKEAAKVYAGFHVSNLKETSPLYLVFNKDKIPSFLTEPKKEEPPSTLRAMIATVGF